MFRSSLASSRAVAKWCGVGLILLAPGSFLILPLFWLIRHFSVTERASKSIQQRGSLGAAALASARGSRSVA